MCFDPTGIDLRQRELEDTTIRCADLSLLPRISEEALWVTESEGDVVIQIDLIINKPCPMISS